LRVTNPISEYKKLFQLNFLFSSNRITIYFTSTAYRLFLNLRKIFFILIIAFNFLLPKRLIQT